MDLELDKGLKKQTKINDEVNLFIKELSNSLKQKTTNNFQTTITKKDLIAVGLNPCNKCNL